MLTNALGQLRAKNLGPGKHPVGHGLWLVKRTKDAGKWILRVAVSGKRREMGLGRWPDVSIAEARERAAAARRTQRDGLDPIQERAKSKRTMNRLTVAEAIEGCFSSRQAQLKADGYAGRWMSPMNVHVIPKIGRDAIEDVDQHVLKELLTPIWHKKPEAAAKALNRMNLTLQHAAALGLSVDLQATMKARALLGKQRHETEHIPALPYAQAPDFYKWLCTIEGVSARALRFLMVTLGRTSEVRLAEASEIQGEIWTLPRSRTKSGIERRIPLVGEARKLVTKEGVLFPAHKGQPISDAAMATLMRRNGYDARPHGFRSTFRTWCEEVTGADFETKESCLGHIVDTGVVGAYQRSDRFEKRKKLLEQWETFLLA